MAIEEEADAGIPEWVVTFGDMMSLLLTFFIMLVSLSEIKSEEKYQALVDSIREQFGYNMSSASMAPGHYTPRNAALAKLASAGRARRNDTLNGGDKVRAPVGDHPRVKMIRPAKHITNGGLLYFAPGLAELSETQKQQLQAIALEIGGKRQKIEVRGHASNRPLPQDSTFDDRWELAYARGRSVVEFLVSLGIDPKRIRLSSAGSHEPAHTGGDPLLLKQNDRVEVFLLDEIAEEHKDTAAIQENQLEFSDDSQRP